MSLFVPSLLLTTAYAVPVQTMHQGRLLDGDGLPMEGEIEATFRLVDSDTGGTIVWEETLLLSLTDGFYISLLGADEDENPLDTDALDQAPLWLELQITGEPAMFPRSPVTSAPYARIAGIAEEVDGGLVNASEVQVDGLVVIDSSGLWVGAPPAIDWSDLSGLPVDFVDGLDADTLADMICEEDQVIRWVGATWDCSDDIDTWRSDEEIQAAVMALPLDLASGSTVGGTEIATGSHTTTLGWSDISGIPTDFADGTDQDTQLSEPEVESYITNDSIDLAAGTTVAGELLATGPGIPSGVIVMWSGSTDEIPEGWALCDGDDGRPNLLNRFIRSIADYVEVPGALGGQDSISLTESQMPAHSHGVADPGHNHSTTRVCASGPTTGLTGVVSASPCGSLGTSSTTTGISIAEAGSGAPIDNRPAFYTLAFIIKL